MSTHTLFSYRADSSRQHLLAVHTGAATLPQCKHAYKQREACAGTLMSAWAREMRQTPWLHVCMDARAGP